MHTCYFVFQIAGGLEVSKLCHANLPFVDNPSFYHTSTLQVTFTELAACPKKTLPFESKVYMGD